MPLVVRHGMIMFKARLLRFRAPRRTVGQSERRILVTLTSGVKYHATKGWRQTPKMWRTK